MSRILYQNYLTRLIVLALCFTNSAIASSEQWKIEVPGSYIQIQDQMVFRIEHGNMIARKIASGETIWKVKDSFLGSPLLADSIILAGSGTNRMTAINARNGKIIWNSILTGSIQKKMSLQISNVGIAQNVLIVTTNQGIWAINRANGHNIWVFPALDPTNTMFFNHKIGIWQLGNARGTLTIGLNLKDGSEVWQRQTGSGIVSMSNNLVWIPFPLHQNSVQAIDPSNGDLTTFDFSSIIRHPADRLFIIGDQVCAYAFAAGVECRESPFFTNKKVTDKNLSLDSLFPIGDHLFSLKSFRNLCDYDILNSKNALYVASNLEFFMIPSNVKKLAEINKEVWKCAIGLGGNKYILQSSNRFIEFNTSTGSVKNVIGLPKDLFQIIDVSGGRIMNSPTWLSFSYVEK